MSNWKKIVESDQTFWENEKIGMIMLSADQKYVIMIPKMVKFGPTATLEEAIFIAENHQFPLQIKLDELNLELCK